MICNWFFVCVKLLIVISSQSNMNSIFYITELLCGYDFWGVGGDVWRWNWGPPHPRTMLYLGGQMGVLSKVFLGFRNIGYDFWAVGGGVWRWLCRHVQRNISTHADGGKCERSSVRRLWAKTPIGVSGNLLSSLLSVLFRSGWVVWGLVGWEVETKTNFILARASLLGLSFATNQNWMHLIHIIHTNLKHPKLEISLKSTKIAYSIFATLGPEERLIP